MVAEDEDALICDMAEYYRIMDYRRLPLRTAAIMAQGLPEDSRIKRRLSGAKAAMTTILLAGLCDRVGLIGWLLSEDGAKGQNRPKSILDTLLWSAPEQPAGYDTPADFEKAWAELTEKKNGD